MFFSTFILPIIVQPKIFIFVYSDFEMAKHHPDLIFCRKQAGKFKQQKLVCKKILGVAIGRLCDKCDGRCVICDSYVRPSTLVRICDECNYGSFQVKILNLKPTYYKCISNIMYYRGIIPGIMMMLSRGCCT